MRVPRDGGRSPATLATAHAWFRHVVRIAAIVLFLGGLAIGLSHPLAIALILGGLLLVVALQRHKTHRPAGATH